MIAVVAVSNHGNRRRADPTPQPPPFGPRWRPSTFSHDRFFALDRDHNTACATCHVNNDLTRYTCFGCHEHTPANVRAEHEEEGIRDLDNCVSCHRGADGEAGEHGERRRGREHDEH